MNYLCICADTEIQNTVLLGALSIQKFSNSEFSFLMSTKMTQISDI